jgi:succinate dehydrogenase/fumarate reductase flavoprotein subunit
MAASRAKQTDRPQVSRKEAAAEKARLESYLSKGRGDAKKLRRRLGELMWYKAGIIRRAEELEEAVKKIEEFSSLVRDVAVTDFRQVMRSLELRNMLLVAEMVCRSALLRTESRGAHYRSDWPEQDDAHWLKNIVIQKRDSKMNLQTAPVAMDLVRP